MGKPYVSAVASPRSHKNTAVSFETARLVAQSEGICIVHAGHAPGGATIGTLSDEDMYLFIAGSDAFLCSSLIEGYGFPALEALATGTPVVCGPGLGALPILGEGVLVVDIRDARAVAAGLIGLLSDERRRDEMGEKGMVAARSLTIGGMTDRTVMSYRQLLGTK